MARRMGSRVSFGRPLEEEGLSDEPGVGEPPIGKNFSMPSPSCAALMDLPYDFGVRTCWPVMLSQTCQCNNWFRMQVEKKKDAVFLLNC